MLTSTAREYEEPHARGVERIVDDEKMWTDFKSRLLASKIGRNNYNTRKILSDMLKESKDRYRSNSISRRSSLDSPETSSSRSQHYGLIHNKGNCHSNKESSTHLKIYTAWYVIPGDQAGGHRPQTSIYRQMRTGNQNSTGRFENKGVHVDLVTVSPMFLLRRIC